MLNLVSRPIPGAKEWMKMETQVGRYCQHNLLSVAWAEIALRYFEDFEMDLLDHVIGELLAKDPFVTVLR